MQGPLPASLISRPHRDGAVLEEMDFDEILKFSCGLSGKIDLMPTLKLATVLSAWAEPIEADCFADIFPEGEDCET